MNYTEAKDALLAHKYVTRNCQQWNDELAYLVFLPGLTHFLKVTLVPKANVVPFAADIENSHANDWEVIEPAQVKLPEVEKAE